MQVAIKCWNTTTEIVDWMLANNRGLTENSYLDLWSDFHNRALDVYDSQAGDSNSDIIVWSSGLTNPRTVEKHLNKNRYIVEVWHDNTMAEDLVNLGYKVIVANEDVYYLDHGLRPPTRYHTWKVIYNNKLPTVNNSKLILGAEVLYNNWFVNIKSDYDTRYYWDFLFYSFDSVLDQYVFRIRRRLRSGR